MWMIAFCSIYSGYSQESTCISTCPPNCNSHILHGRHKGCFGGEFCSFECDQGYEKAVGFLHCRDGVLKPFRVYYDEPICQPKSCPDMIPNGVLSGHCTAKVGFTCEYTCNDGYSKSANVTTIECEPTTNWSPNPHSLCTNNNQCPYEIPGADLDLSCRRHPGDTCKYTCRDGYVQSQYETVDCQTTLDWKQRVDFYCNEIFCPLHIDHGRILFPCTRKYDEDCHLYKCDPGFVKPPRPRNLKCNYNGTSSTNTIGYWEWDLNMGKPCARETDLCPSAIPNGKVSASCHRQPGAMCYYRCDPGCEEHYSVSKVHCGQHGRWTEETDYLCSNCKRCPSDLAHGQISEPCDRIPTHSCSFTCSDGCNKAVPTLYCDNDGEWMTTWGNSNPCVCPAESGAGSHMSPLSAVIIVVAILFVICAFAYVTHRCRKQRTNSPSREENNSIPMLPPSAPPLDTLAQRSLQANNGYRLNHEVQTPSRRYTDTSRSQEPPAYGDCSTSETNDDDDSAYRIPGFRTDMTSISDLESPRPHRSDNDTSDQPPTYEEAISDPSLQVKM